MRRGLIALSALLFLFPMAWGVNRSRTIKNSEAVLELNGKTFVTVKAGTLMSYSGVVHGSVGKWLLYKTEGDEILSVADEKKEYFYPEKIAAGMKGADKAKLTYIFKALEPGKVILHMIKEYRFEEESRESIEIIVEP